MDNYDLFIFAAENSADIHGANLIKELLYLNPNLKILSVAGPSMRRFNIKTILKMENFNVMGFCDIISSLLKLIKNFFFLRKIILKHNPKVCIFIDYPDFNLRLEKSLRKKGFKNALIHYISPTIWAWRKKRSDFMAKYLDLLITIFPFEKKHFSHTNLKVKYIGHPLANIISSSQQNYEQKNLIGIFPGSRQKEILRNFPIQLEVAKKLLNNDNQLKFAISSTNLNLTNDIFKKSSLDKKNFVFFSKDQNYNYMQKLKIAMATSGTINLELALFKVPTVVNFLIKPLDLFIARNILKINLPFYCIVNIILNEEVFYELYGPNLTIDSLYKHTHKLLYNENIQTQCKLQCENLIKVLKKDDANKNLAKMVSSFL